VPEKFFPATPQGRAYQMGIRAESAEQKLRFF
jgi:hypothetical protein